MNASDETLVNGVLNGDRTAFAELYDRRARVIRALCYDATRDLAAAADLTQECFLRAWRNLANLRDRSLFGSWLIGIAHQVCREWRRGRLRRWRLVDESQNAASTDDPPVHADPPDARLVELREAVAGLPEKERLALHAFYLQELDVERTCSLLELSRSGLYHVLSRARQRLRKMLSRTEVHP